MTEYKNVGLKLASFKGQQVLSKNQQSFILKSVKNYDGLTKNIDSAKKGLKTEKKLIPKDLKKD